MAFTKPQVTDTYSRIGVNRVDGIVYSLHLRSLEKGAEILWDDLLPNPAALPKLRFSFDLAFGLWNCVAAPSGHKIEKFISVNIVNEDVEEITKRALRKANVDEVQLWLGTDFDTTGDAGKTLVGKLLIQSQNVPHSPRAILIHSRFTK